VSAPRLALSFTPPLKNLNDSIKCNNSTRSKCPLRKRTCIFTFHAEAQKRKLQNYSPSAPLPPQRNKTKPKKKKKKSKTKTTRKKIQEKKKKQGNDRAMKKSFTATKNKCQINPGNA
jgi:FKBP-type peptidyl-prolyl cis-trans isomerase